MNHVELAVSSARTLPPGPPKRGGSHSLLGRFIVADRSSCELRGRILRIAAAQLPVLVTGEAGTGKRLVAGILHTESAQAREPLVVASPEATADASDIAGWLDAAAGGTLLLDHIERHGAGFVTGLAEALRSREGRHPRVVATSRLPVHELKAAHAACAELLALLGAAELVLPPLRCRRDDVVPIAAYLARTQAGRFRRPAVVIEPGAAARLRDYAWPGNVRELVAVVLQALAVRAGPRMRARDVRLPETAAAGAPLRRQMCDLIGRMLEENTPRLRASVLEALVTTAYERSGRNQARTTRALGTSRNVIRADLARFGLITVRPRKGAA